MPCKEAPLTPAPVRRRLRLLPVPVVCLCLLALSRVAVPAFAAAPADQPNITFVQTGTNSSNLPIYTGTWSPADAGAGVVNTVSSGVTYGWVDVVSATDVGNAGTLSLNFPGYTADDRDRMTFTVNGGAGTLTNTGALNLNPSGSYNGSVYVYGNLVNDTGGTVTVASGTAGGQARFGTAGASHVNRGTITATGSSGVGGILLSGGGTSFTQSVAGSSLSVTKMILDNTSIYSGSGGAANVFSVPAGSLAGYYVFRHTQVALGAGATVPSATTFKFEGEDSAKNTFTGDVPANLTLLVQTYATSDGAFLGTPAGLANQGVIRLRGTDGYLPNGAVSRLIVAGGDGTLTNNGTLDAETIPGTTHPGEARVVGNVVNNGTVILAVRDDTGATSYTHLEGDLTNEATGTVNVVVSGTAVGDSHVRFTDGAAGTYINRGLFNLQAGTLDLMGGTLQNQGAGRLIGNGTVTGNVTSAATTAPGASAGILTVTGNFTQTADGTLEIEIGGPVAGTGFDRLVVSGTASLDGDVWVEALNDYKPLYLQTFDVVTATSVVLSDGTLDLVGPLGGRFSYEVVDGTTLRLISLIPEPASLGLLMLAGALALPRRRGRKPGSQLSQEGHLRFR
ncbi:MAG: hypothetical protein BWZ02_01639 [Lentisphaerae bacterium ADurb.BinA184]|nr:MAG: hypothetical protein BWZ02_01639 [Lentisphaerae bacterium ADurb.BinA184]